MLHTESVTIPARPRIAGSALQRRVLGLVAALIVEYMAISAAPHPWCSIHRQTAAGIAFAGALLVFGRKRLALQLDDETPLNRGAIGVHGVALLLIAATYLYLLVWGSPDSSLGSAAIAVWFASIALMVGSAIAVVAPWETLRQSALGLGSAWIYAFLCGALGGMSRPVVEWVWDAPESRLGRVLQAETFRGVQALLGIFYRGVVSEPASSTIGTAGFQVQIAGGCSGIEGLGLMLVLGVGWLVFARRELRMSRAVWLVPVSLCAIWLTNLVRITALIAIGQAGYGAVAVGGFHSEAGWILFNVVAIGFLVAANQVSWFRVAGPGEVVEARTNVVAVYLLPFLAILTASIAAQAVSSGFEWLYPLRLVAAVGALWYFRRHLRLIDWGFDWLGPLAGLGVFVLWMAFARYLLPAGSGDGLAAALGRLTPLERFCWIAARVLAAVVTVPIAEELAFRGFVARRIVSEDVESVAYGRLTAVAIGASSLLFGVMHGRLWLAGLAFAWVARRRNRLGEAVAAHAVANLLIAIWVLARGDYSLW